MTTTNPERLVDEYLRRLDSAAAHLQRSRRAELVAQIREHIEAALRQQEAADEIAVRNVLERLGPPDEIVDAAEPPTPTDGGSSRPGKLEIAALIALVVPFVGWLVGTVLVLVSQMWSRRDKLVGITLALLPVLLPFAGVVVGGQSGGSEAVPPGDPRPVGLEENGGSGLGSLEVAVLAAFLFFAGLPSAFFLAWRLRRM